MRSQLFYSALLFAAFSIFTSTTVIGQNLDSVIIAYYPLDGDATDHSGNNLDGIIHSAEPTKDRFGNENAAYYFNGDSAFIDCGNPTDFQMGLQDFSMRVWFKRDTYNHHSGYIAGKRGFIGPVDYVYALAYWQNDLYAAYRFDDHSTLGFLTHDINDTAWHHAVVNFDRDGNCDLYVDKALVGSVDISSSVGKQLNANPGNFMIGRDDGPKKEFFKGAIDEVRVYSRTLSMDEIFELYDLDAPPICYVCETGNMAYGMQALQSNIGNFNTALGSEAGYNGLGSGNVYIGYNVGKNKNSSNKLMIANNADSSLIYGDFSNGYVGFGVDHPSARLYVNGEFKMDPQSTICIDRESPGSRFHIDKDGRVRINTIDDPGEYHLMVNGHIRTKELTAEPTTWPDNVFQKGYNLMPLNQLRKYIEKNAHLPGIPTARQVEEQGIQIAEMNSKLLEKIEELSLYIL